MADISRLTEKIIDEAREQSDKILSEADEKVSKIENNARSQAEQSFAQIVKKAEQEAEIIKDRLRSSAVLRARDNELRAKQEVIKEVVRQGLEDLKNLDSKRYIEYIKNNFSFEKDSELVVTASMVKIVKEELSGVRVSSDRFVDSGFIEVSGGVEKNFTFETQLSYIKDEIQGELAKVIF